MNTELTKSDEYINFIKGIKLQIKNVQMKAATTVNKELLKLYWNLAKNIIEKQEVTSWGEGILSTIAKDLKKEFPNMKGCSERNLYYTKKEFQLELLIYFIILI